MQVLASTFADIADVAAFRRWKAIYIKDGLTDEQATKKAYAKGDDGVGCTGLNCASIDIPYIALPPDDWMEKFGSKEKAMGHGVNVTINGVTKRCVLGDRMPWKKNITNGCGMDIAPGAQRLFGLNAPCTVHAEWEWA